jgi:hypothetical protein
MVTDYYIPLSEVAGSLGLGRIPAFGEHFERLLQSIGVRSWVETWNDTDSVIRGKGVLGDQETTWDCGAFTLSMGTATSGSTEFDFELILDRSSLLDTALSLAGEVEGDVSELDGKLQVFFRSDGPPRYARMVIRGLGLHLIFDRDTVRKGKVVTTPEGKTRIEPEEGDDTADILLLPPAIIFDSRLSLGFDIELDDDQLVVAPPLRIMADDETALCSLLIEKIKLDLSPTEGFAEALARGYDESWRGVYFERLAVYGLDEAFPLLPNKVDATNWFIGTDGISGALSVSLGGGVFLFKDLTFGLEFERGNLIKFAGELTVMVGSLDSSLASLGPEGDLLFGFALRMNPEGGTLVEGVLRTPHPSDPNNDIGLFTLKEDIVQFLPTVLAVIGASGGLPLAATVPAMILHLFTIVDWFSFKALTLDAIGVRRRPVKLHGHELRWLDFILDIKVKFGLNIPLSLLGLPIPDIKTKPDHPITLVIRGLRFSVGTNREDFTEQELTGIPAFDLGLDDKEGAFSFEVGDKTVLDDSPFIITKAAIGRWEKGLWWEVGIKFSKKTENLSFSVIPSVIRFWHLDNGDLEKVTFQSASFSIVVPRTIYARGEWHAGEISGATGKAMILGLGASLAKPEDPKNWVYVVGFGLRQQDLPPPPQPKQVTSRLIAFEFETSSGIPTVICPSMNLYGISGLYAEHARPALGGGTPSQWLTQRSPQYQVGIEKWEAAQGHSGWAASVILGAALDQGRPWNLKAGFVYLSPGPVLMLFGTANWLKQRKPLKDTNPAALNFFATLDLDRREFLIGARYERRIPDSTGRVLKLVVPAELFISGAGWHIYLGQDKPEDRFISAQIFAKYTVAGYLMIGSSTITNLAGLGVDVPGTAIALGVRFGYEGGRKGSRYKLVYYFKAAADVAVSLTEPRLTIVRARVAGGLVAKAFGIGFEFEISAEFLWIRPTPDYLHALVKVKLNLPWPIPDLTVDLDLTKGADGEGEPLVGGMVEGLSLYLRSSQKVIEIKGPAPQADVPIDPVFSLAFKYPTRNGAAVPGSFNLSDGNESTFYYVGGETGGARGYAIRLEALTLFKTVGGVRQVVPGPFPALWRPTPIPAAGGQPDKRILELFAYDGITASRFIGAAAEYVDWAAHELDPCPPYGPPGPVCYQFEQEVLGAIDAPRRVLPSDPREDTRVLVMWTAGEGEGAESVRRYYGSITRPAEVVIAPITGPPVRMVALPSTDGFGAAIAAGGRLVLQSNRANEAELEVLIYPGGQVKVTAWLGEALVDESAGEQVGLVDDKWILTRYLLKGPFDRLEVEAAHDTAHTVTKSFLRKVCLLYTADVVKHHDQDVSGQSWSTFWSDLLTQNAAASNALLLEPGQQYSLDVVTSWAHLHEDGTLGTPHSNTETFSFNTVAPDKPPLSLRGPTAALNASDWEIRTVPADGAVAVYTERPIRLEFRDARIDKVYGAFGKRVVLRLTDSMGEDLFDRLEYLRENAKDLPEYQNEWKDQVTGMPCSPPDLDVLWSMGVAHFPSVLARSRAYNGTMVMLPDTITDLLTVTDWEQYPVVCSFRFTTSRYPSLDEHVGAYEVFDLVCEGLPELAAARAAIGAQLPGGHRTDGTLLWEVLLALLRVPVGGSPADPELVRVWGRTAESDPEVWLVALLLDGLEPLFKSGLDSAAVDLQGIPVPLLRLDREDGARTLLLFESPVSRFVGDVTLTVTTSYIGANGLPQTDTVHRVVTVPLLPASLVTSAAP